MTLPRKWVAENIRTTRVNPSYPGIQAFSPEGTIMSTYLKLLTSLALTCELTGITFKKFPLNTAHPIPMTAVPVHYPASAFTLLF